MDTIRFIFLVISILYFVSCSSSGDTPVEECVGSDTKIGLETNFLYLSGAKSRSVVKTQTPFQIHHVIVNDKNGEKKYINEGYIYDNGRGDFYEKAKENLSFDWFKLSHPNFHFIFRPDYNPVIHSIHNELTVELEENNTDMERSLMIYLRTEMQGDSLKIVQKFNGSF